MKDYKCNICFKVFTEKRSLLRNMKNAHDKQQGHKCEICEKDFLRLSIYDAIKKVPIIEQVKCNAPNATK